jgi:hypothetical protein
VCLNVAAVGAVLASLTGEAIGPLSAANAPPFVPPTDVLAASLSTLLVGAGWARLLRWPRNLFGVIPAGIAYSLPLAFANCFLAELLAFSFDDPSDVAGLLLGYPLFAALGAVVSLPALALTLVLFGLPLTRARRMAEAGLAGSDRAEVLVGAMCAVLGTLAFSLSFSAPPEIHQPATWWLRALASLGTTSGAFALAIAVRRSSRRRAFVAAVEAGQQPGFRVLDAPEGKVLVRVALEGAGYRVADLEEELFALDRAGEAVAEVTPAPPI